MNKLVNEICKMTDKEFREEVEVKEKKHMYRKDVLNKGVIRGARRFYVNQMRDLCPDSLMKRTHLYTQ